MEVVVLAAPGMRILIQSGSYFDVLITKGLEQDFVCRSVGRLLPWYDLPLIHQFQPDLGDDTLLILGEALRILPGQNLDLLGRGLLGFDNRRHLINYRSLPRWMLLNQSVFQR